MLRIHFSDNHQAPVWLAAERFGIGSGADNDLVLEYPGVSAKHAEIRQENGHYYLSDCLSESGTFVNGERISGNFQLRDGDKVRIGGRELQLVDPARSNLKLASPPARWSLQVMQGEHEGRKFPITGSMTFGRSVKCELCFSDIELSRRHCEFFLKNDVLEIKDLASANGVFVNHQKVSTAVLQSGDQLRMGSVTLMVIGPKVDVREEVQEDATRFMRVADLPAAAQKPAEKPSGRAGAANPLHAAQQPEPAAVPQRAAGSTMLIPLMVGALLVVAVVVAAVVLL
ncbi:FHA domain-containing protein [Pseudomonas mangrovi]|uniref:FHA domain-containing protein n=1 Tax=Pseudomonas mangrovi TaxID=2161748 RepID=A0A2T5PCV8_9PSED|nr:FHA domain-containing protein [Pseudomonas mangrovi]PTU75544.1 FHA domain-containing protein [Pseudomonas mangrovi]